MLGAFFHSIIYVPIYNALAFTVAVLPTGDIGLAVIILTIAVKVVLLPLSIKAAHTQHAMKEIDPLARELKEKYKNNSEELAKRTLALYKEKEINPFSSVFLALIQIPVIIGLYFVFISEVKTFTFDPTLLYSFTLIPHAVSAQFLGFFDLTQKSIPLAVIAAITQYFQGVVAMPKPAVKKAGEARSFQDDLTQSFSLQMRFVLPVVIGFVAYAVSSAVALYFITSALFAVMQEYISRWSIKRKVAARAARQAASL